MPRESLPQPARSTMKTVLEATSARPGIDGQALLQAAITEAFERVNLLLHAHYADFSPAQQRKIRAVLGVENPIRPSPPRRPATPARDDGQPRFWLPFSGETWSGRGRPPKAFAAWEGTVAHTEWKKHHPNERFPAYPG